MIARNKISSRLKVIMANTIFVCFLFATNTDAQKCEHIVLLGMYGNNRYSPEHAIVKKFFENELKQNYKGVVTTTSHTVNDLKSGKPLFGLKDDQYVLYDTYSSENGTMECNFYIGRVSKNKVPYSVHYLGPIRFNTDERLKEQLLNRVFPEIKELYSNGFEPQVLHIAYLGVIAGNDITQLIIEKLKSDRDLVYHLSPLKAPDADLCGEEYSITGNKEADKVHLYLGCSTTKLISEIHTSNGRSIKNDISDIPYSFSVTLLK